MDYFGETETYIIGEIKINITGAVKYGLKNTASPAILYNYLSEAEIEKIFDATEEKSAANECPLGGDITNDCADCVYSVDYCYSDGECIRRKE